MDRSPAGVYREAIYTETLREIRRLLVRPDALPATVGLLQERFDHYSWVGYYRVCGDELVLGPWRGPQATEHVRIRVGEGVCGSAAASGTTEVVDDVHLDARYLACFLSTRSEIVVPVVRDGRVVGEIDIDSDRLRAFGDEDRAFLEQVAALVARAPEAGGPGEDWIVEEWGRESFPASDPPARWAGADSPPV